MNFTMTKVAAALALAMAANGAYALTVDSMNISDTVTAAGALGADGKSGAFRFGAISLTTYTGASLWTGDVNGGAINMSGGAPLDFSTGFIFAGSAFQPFNAQVNGGVVAAGSGDIVMSTSAAADAAAVGTVLSGSDLIITSLPWAGYYVGASFNFNQTPDAGSLVVNNFIKTGANSYAYRMSFVHDITSADDPSLSYTIQTARWVLEGTLTTAPVPEASTYGMMLSGLGLVGAVVARRRRSAK